MKLDGWLLVCCVGCQCSTPEFWGSLLSNNMDEANPMEVEVMGENVPLIEEVTGMDAEGEGPA